jgi:hypothetical protein
VAEEVEEQSPRRLRWLVLLALLGAAAWFLRSRRAPAVDLGDPWPLPRPAPPSPAGPLPAASPTTPARTTSAAATRTPPPRGPAASARPSPRPRKPSPAPASVAEPEVPPGSAAALPDGSAPGPEYTIKGNAGSMLFHAATSPYYRRTKAELWFRTPEDARAAGFTEWTPKKRTKG